MSLQRIGLKDNFNDRLEFTRLGNVRYMNGFSSPEPSDDLTDLTNLCVTSR